MTDKSQYSDDTMQEIKYGALCQSGVVCNGLWEQFIVLVRLTMIKLPC